MEAVQVDIDYTNWRGVRAWRRICPIRLMFSSTEWHPTPQWLLSAFDVDREEERIFAMADIHSWKPAPPDAAGRAALTDQGSDIPTSTTSHKDTRK